MSKIKSRVHEYGNAKEASWPPQFPETAQGFHGYWDKEQQRFMEGSPPIREKIYGEAPTVIFDSMPKTYHHGIQREIETRSEWRAADAAAGTITFGSREEAAPRIDQANERKKRRQEIRKASVTAMQAYRENPREVSQRVEKQTIAKIEKAKKDFGVDI